MTPRQVQRALFTKQEAPTTPKPSRYKRGKGFCVHCGDREDCEEAQECIGGARPFEKNKNYETELSKYNKMRFSQLIKQNYSIQMDEMRKSAILSASQNRTHPPRNPTPSVKNKIGLKKQKRKTHQDT